jgi:hypothetical protein
MAMTHRDENVVLPGDVQGVAAIHVQLLRRVAHGHQAERQLVVRLRGYFR